ncbi:uncharacterized protein BO66DRAFT_81872 [Aspergillus aculeatinus CBS 121060]|uniref:Uncharacterized protein n=1 Tax=Aspergillus aculeatinus CBS 121060 TaxID=1448322 RepID=A0ACD1H9Y5_9EURO|nr:hypothetical protein BO66DRAFT_81872 [Aspergillus aculeatinus CBS 121060]RAH70474.1 hypothetical protein BO66DRAFT_81872 [Aspergillus aculeatinus CBS 121060]
MSMCLFGTCFSAWYLYFTARIGKVNCHVAEAVASVPLLYLFAAKSLMKFRLIRARLVPADFEYSLFVGVDISSDQPPARCIQLTTINSENESEDKSKSQSYPSYRQTPTEPLQLWLSAYLPKHIQ